MSRGSSAPELTGREQSSLPTERFQRLFPWAVSTFLFLVLIAFGAVYFFSPATERPTVRTVISPPEKASFYFFGNTSGPPVLSPD